jgi:hypothetical protein
MRKNDLVRLYRTWRYLKFEKTRAFFAWMGRWGRHLSNEFSHWRKGDTRTDFEKTVHRCRYLKLYEIIENTSFDPKHT